MIVAVFFPCKHFNFCAISNYILELLFTDLFIYFIVLFFWGCLIILGYFILLEMKVSEYLPKIFIKSTHQSIK